MDLQLQHDLAVITGGASGIGKAIACGFAEQGASVAILDRSAGSEDVAAEIRDRFSVTATPFMVDVTDFSAMKNVADQVSDQQDGRIHLICAAGMGSGKYGFPFWNLEPADWPRVLDVNLMGVVNAAHAFAPVMAQRRTGTMTFIASVAAQIGSQTDPPYSAAKAAVINFAQCAAKDLAEYDVRVNVISPGMVQTPLNRSVWQSWNDRQPADSQRSYEDWAGEKIKKIAPLNRWQEPEDIAAMAVFLASPQAKNITGQTLNIDGGQVMHS